MWIVRHLKELGCPREELLDVVRQQILSVVEQAVPYWAPMITKNESQMLERILKTALHIILQDQYVNFRHALKLTRMRSLSNRRKEIFYKFCKKSEKSEVFQNWFAKPEQGRTARYSKPVYRPVNCRTTRFDRSPISAMTKVVSWHPPKIFMPPQMY